MDSIEYIKILNSIQINSNRSSTFIFKLLLSILFVIACLITETEKLMNDKKFAEKKTKWSLKMQISLYQLRVKDSYFIIIILKKILIFPNYSRSI